MKFKFSREWLNRKLKTADDTAVGAGGTSREELRRDLEGRTVTPTVFADIPTQLGKVVRFIRERRGLSHEDLAAMASIEASEVRSIESDAQYVPSPRSVIYLADALDLSRRRLQELVGFVKAADAAPGSVPLRFAANSKGVRAISQGEYEAVRALVDVLSEKKFED